MKKQKFPICKFDIFSTVITVLVMLFIFIALGSIVLEGLPYIRQAFFSEEVKFAITLSLYTSSVSTLICLVLAIPTAYTLAKTPLPCKHFFEILIELPLSLPHIVLGVCLLLVFSSNLGKLLAEHGFKVIYTQYGIILAHIFINLPFTVRIIKTAFMGIDTRLEFAARTLGASKFNTFVKVTLPLAKNAIIGAMVLAWSRALGEFGAALMVAGATRMKTETLPATVYLNMATGNIGEAMASAIILLVISMVSLFIFNKLNVKNRNRGMYFG